MPQFTLKADIFMYLYNLQLPRASKAAEHLADASCTREAADKNY